MRFRLSLLGILLLTAVSARAAGPAIRCGEAVLESYSAGGGRFGIRLAVSGKALAVQPAPIAVEIVDERSPAAWIGRAYASVAAKGGRLTCRGVVQTSHGTRFVFTDTYKPISAGFRVDRVVDVRSPSPQDRGFSTRLAMPLVAGGPMAAFDALAPGVWYKGNAHVPPTAIASDITHEFSYIREDRLALPLFMLRDKRSGLALSFIHVNTNARTFAGEDGLNRRIDARMQFGSLGVHATDRPALTFLFPGTEGDKTYVYGGSREARWALRSHPVKIGVAHRYSVVIRVAKTPDYPAAVRDVWRAAYALHRPPVIRVDLKRFHADGIRLLADFCKPHNGVPGLPFALRVPGAQVDSVSYQMGFIGMQIPAAALLIRAGLTDNDPALVAKGEAVVDFWAKESPTPSGMPRTWYDVEGHQGWRNYNTYMRVAADGMDGALSAWTTMHRAGKERPAWLSFCRRFGDWLVSTQNADGSFFRAFDFDGRPTERSTYNTTHPIPFLAHLYQATGDDRYRDAAIRAGEFCWSSVHEAYDYIGGTPDNPNVVDKEAGLKALDAFLALYDLTKDRKWVTAGARAADYSETWLVCWNVPMPDGDPGCDFPKSRTTHGLSLIATGHSGADTFMSGFAWHYYRLYRLTGDGHYLNVTRILLHDTKQLTDWDRTLGYAYPALQTEALALSLLRGHSVRVWLPWLTVLQLEPLDRLLEDFGAMDVDAGVSR